MAIFQVGKKINIQFTGNEGIKSNGNQKGIQIGNFK